MSDICYQPYTCTGNLDKVQVNNICSLVLLYSNFVGAYLGDLGRSTMKIGDGWIMSLNYGRFEPSGSAARNSPLPCGYGPSELHRF